MESCREDRVNGDRGSQETQGRRVEVEFGEERDEKVSQRQSDSEEPDVNGDGDAGPERVCPFGVGMLACSGPDAGGRAVYQCDNCLDTWTISFVAVVLRSIGAQ